MVNTKKEVFMKNLEKTIKDNALNAQSIYKTLDLEPKRRFSTKLVGSFALAAALVFAIAFGAMINAPTNPIVDDTAGFAIAYFNVEINPQFEIAVDEDGIVLEIKALNDDAETFDTDDLIGLEVEDAIEQLISMAVAFGYIDAENVDEGFVTITSVVIDDENEEDVVNVESIGYRIRARIEASGEVDPRITVVYVKATIAEKMEAEGKDVPLGMYVINGMIEVDGEMIPVSEHVKNENALEKMTQGGVMVQKRDQAQSNRPDHAEESDDDESLEDNDNDQQNQSQRGENENIPDIPSPKRP
jgi:hypothetical protein